MRALLSDNCDVDLDDPLKDEEQLTEQLETLPSLCRFQLQQVVRVRVRARVSRNPNPNPLP